MNTNNNFELLVDRLDGILSESEMKTADAMIATDANLAMDSALLEFAVRNIREAGLYRQVSAVRDQFTQTNTSATNLADNEEKTEAKVINFSFRSTALRVAAAVLVLLVSATTYKYIAVTDKSVYDKYYSTYELNTSRDRTPVDKMEAAYRNRQWAEVIAAGESAQASPKATFMSGVAHMELKQFEPAIASFGKVIAVNKQTGDAYFQDEAEYYLAMSYLGARKDDLALRMLSDIKNDPAHVFNARVKKMNLDLKILQIKK